MSFEFQASYYTAGGKADSRRMMHSLLVVFNLWARTQRGTLRLTAQKLFPLVGMVNSLLFSQKRHTDTRT